MTLPHRADDAPDLPRVSAEPIGSGPTPAGGLQDASLRLRLALCVDNGWRNGDHDPEPALPDGTLVLTDDARYASELADRVNRSGGRVICTDPACDPEFATVVTEVTESTVREVTYGAGPFGHIRAIGNGQVSGRWPQPPASASVRLGEMLFLALKNHADILTTTASVGVLVVAGFVGSVPTPYASLLTGALKSFLWDHPHRPYIGVVTDAPDLATGLNHLGIETGCRTPYWRRDMLTAYYRHGIRHFWRIIDDPMVPQSPPIPADAVVVASGGAGGITAACLRELAVRGPAMFWLLGSTDLNAVPAAILALPDAEFAAHRRVFISESRQADADLSVAELSRRYDRFERAREIQRNIDDLVALAGSGRVRYLACDVTDPVAVDRAAARIFAETGRIDLFVHGAGIQRVGELERKTLSNFRAVRDVKILGYHNLKEAFGPKVARWCSFGSAAGVVGLPGESDYTIANEYVGIASVVEREVRGFDEQAIAFTVWNETGLASDARGTFLFAKTLTHCVSNREGQRFFADHLSDPTAPYVFQLDTLGRRSVNELLPSLCERPVVRPETPVSAPIGANRRVVTTLRRGGREVCYGRFFLDHEVSRHDDRMVWEHRYDQESEPYLRQHRIRGYPTVPAVFHLEYAAEAATTLVPGTVVRQIRGAEFTAFLRHYPNRPLTFRIEAQRIEDNAVTVRILSDVIGPDGRLLAADREHSTMTVLLGDPARSAPTEFWTPWPDLPERLVPVDHAWCEPHAQLTGIFTGPRDARLHARGGRSVFDPAVLSGDPTVPWLLTPCVLVDAMVRVPRTVPGQADHLATSFPVEIASVDFLVPGNDVQLYAAEPKGIRLFHDTATDTIVAVGSDDHVLTRLTAMRSRILGRMPLPAETASGSAVLAG